MRAYEFILESLLLEDRMDFLRNQYVPLLDQIIQNTPNRIGDLGDIPEISGTDVFNWMAEKDPSRKKIYLQWILKIFIKNRVPIEDISYVDDLLKQFEYMKNELEPAQRDINQYATVNNLQQIVDAREYQQAEFNQAEHDRAREQSRILYEDETWLVAVPRTEFAAQYWGRGSEWCTAWGDPKGKYPTRSCHYRSYSQTGDIYTIINKHDRESSIQLQFIENELMDWDDDRIEHHDIMKMLPPAVSNAVYTNFYKQIEQHINDTSMGGLPSVDGSDNIITATEWLYQFALYILKKPWYATGMPIAKDAEESIAYDGFFALEYAKNVLKQPWHKSKSPAASYAESRISRGLLPDYDDPEGSEHSHQMIPLKYAIDIMKKPWEHHDSKYSAIAIKTINSFPYSKSQYEKFVSDYEQSNN